MLAIAPRDLLLRLGITLIWGFNLVAGKVGVRELPPALFTALRFALLALLLVPFLRMRRGLMGALVVAALLSGALPGGERRTAHGALAAVLRRLRGVAARRPAHAAPRRRRTLHPRRGADRHAARAAHRRRGQLKVAQ